MLTSNANAALGLAAAAERGLMRSDERWSTRRMVAFVVLFCSVFWIALAAVLVVMIG